MCVSIQMCCYAVQIKYKKYIYIKLKLIKLYTYINMQYEIYKI